MKVNAAVTLVIGLVVGFVVGGMMGPFGKKASPVPTEAEKPPPLPEVKRKAPAAKQPLKPSKPTPSATYKIPIGNAPTLGPDDALVTVVSFFDYQCGYCKNLDETLLALQKEMAAKGKPFRLVMKQFPLDFHKNAEPAAMAALAAQAQGKYWQMHNLLFENIKNLDAASLKNYAAKLGLNMAKFKADIENKTFMTQIKDDMALGAKMGVKGTPASFINGRHVSGAIPKETIESLINEEMAKAQKLVSQGIPASRVYEKILETALEDARPRPKLIPIPHNAPSMGPSSAPVTVQIWSDFQCSFCSKVVPTLKALADKYPTEVRFVFRHLPLHFHKQAFKAAEATMAAHAQGKFWEMHDILFENAKALDVNSLVSYAETLKLDVRKFKEALNNSTYAAYVQSDLDAATEYSIDSTPNFVINGQVLSGAQPQEKFETLINAALKEARKKI